MKKVVRFFSAVALAAYVSMAGTSCQKETNMETPEETVDVPEAASVIHVKVGAGIVNTKSNVVYENNVRTLTFTSGDKLFVKGSLTLNLGEGDVAYTLSGNLAVDAIVGDGTNATFEGDLTLYKNVNDSDPEPVSYNFGPDNPLDLCTSASALLVHEGSTLLGESYFERIAPTVEDLMETCLNVSGDYDQPTHSFSLSAAGTSGDVIPIFNCNIGGLAANTLYDVYLLIGDNANDASGDVVLGGIQSSGMGEATFACYTSVMANTERYYAFRFKNENDWRRAELGSKTLESKVYKITRTAIADPASPVMPTITGTQGTVNDLSIKYEGSSEVDVTISSPSSGPSASYYFNFNVPSATLHLDNLSASSYGHSFIVSYSDMFIELTGSNSIITRGENCIDAFENSIWLSCTGESATLTLTYNEGREGIRAGNIAALAAPGYSVDVTTVSNGNGTKTSTYTVTHTGLLTGEFTINSSGDKVRFSQGNLRYLSTQAVNNGTGTWSFAPHQYSIIGNAENNTNPTVPEVNKSMDLFCWGATGIVDMQSGDPVYPDVNPDNTTCYYYTGNNTLSGTYEWGNVAISNTTLTNSGSEKWRTLTKDEWAYLFNNTSKYGFGLVEGCIGVILLSDGFVDPETNGGSAAFVHAPGTGYSNNVYNGINWKAMEAAGAVFLPAAGYYTDHYENMKNGCAYYWSSTPHESDGTRAYFAMIWIYDNSNASECMISYGNFNQTDLGYTRATRLSVRLVRSN